MSDDLWIKILLGVIAAAPGLLVLWHQIKKDSVDSSATLKKMFDDELNKRRETEHKCDDLQDQIEVLERECASKAKYIRRLSAYIELTGGEVPPIEDTRPRR